jgi:hypothetical protein
MSTEENENEPVSLPGKMSSEATDEEPIEQVMFRETTDAGTVKSSEPALESEDQERFEETAKFEEEIEHAPSDRRRKTTKKVAKPDSNLISNLHDKLRRYSEAGKKSDVTIRDIQRQIKDLDKRTNTKHNQIMRDLQAQVRELQRKIDRIDKSIKSAKSKSKPTAKKIKKRSNKKGSKKNKDNKKSIRR